ncbi:hypothetical protein FPV67DRAFT_1665309 [Lyophyllum atratum]|nr:hypothetical protein FPV67DRAFT_1665309 [Lyophyllum atratum]
MDPSAVTDVFSVLDPDLQTLTCSAVLLSNGVLTSSEFVTVSVISGLITYHEGIASIHISTLIAALRNQFRRLPQWLHDILTLATLSTFLATTRVPDFGAELQNPAHGFRLLDHLSTISVDFSIIEAATPFQQRLFALDASHPKTVQFTHTWAPLNVQPGTHFVLIFILPTTLPLPSPALSHPLLFDDPPTVFHNMLGTPGPNITELFLSSENTTPAALAFSGALPGAAGPVPSFEGPNITSVQGVFEAEQVSAADIAAARYASNNHASLTSLVVQHRAVSTLLVRLGLPDFRCDPKAAAKITYRGFNLKSSAVLDALGWAEASYSKKSIGYFWAERAAQASWKGDIPGIECGEQYMLYRTWRAICWMFRPSGGVDQERAPSATSNNSDEVLASKLVQKSVFSPERRRIASYLDI